MAKTVRIPLDITPELKEKAQIDSKEHFGYVNVNGWIKYLLNSQKTKK